MQKMKLMILASVLFLVPAVAFSGNESTSLLEGNGSRLTVDQTGSNKSEAALYGDNLKGDVLQNGTDNKSELNLGASGSPVNTAPLVGYVTGAKHEQDGDRNKLKTSWGTGNIGSRGVQKGNDNDGIQELNAIQGYAAGRYAIDLEQVGNNHKSLQKTSPKYGSHGIQRMISKQEGSYGDIEQISVGGRSSSMEASEFGNNDVIKQYQDGMFDVALAEIRGDFSRITQNQVSSVWGAETSHNSVIAKIEGDFSSIGQDQFGVRNSLEAEVVGDNSSVDQRQNGKDNFAGALVEGYNSHVKQIQIGDGHRTEAISRGDNNTITVVQRNL